MQSAKLEDKLGAILRALKIREIEYALNGGGDSGETALERVTYQDGTVAVTVPDIPAAITNTGTVITLPDLLERIVSDAPEGDWINNEGGYGTVLVLPFKDETSLQIECDITYNDEDEDEEDFDNEFDEDPNDPDDDPFPSSSSARLAGELGR